MLLGKCEIIQLYYHKTIFLKYKMYGKRMRSFHVLVDHFLQSEKAKHEMKLYLFLHFAILFSRIPFSYVRYVN